MTTKAILVRLPEKIVQEIDKEVKKGYYTSRAELIKDSVRERIEKKEKLERDLAELRSMMGTLKNVKRPTREQRDQWAREFIEKKRKGLNLLRKYGLD